MGKKKKTKKTEKVDSKKKIEKKPKAKKEKKKAKPKVSKVLKKDRRTLSLESREIWKKNIVLVVIVVTLAILNVWFFYGGRRVDNSIRFNEKNQQLDSNKNANESVQNNNVNENDNLSPEERKIIQSLIQEKELASWKTYKNTTYSLQLKYPQDWLEPETIKPEDGNKFRLKISFRNGASQGDSKKGFDIYIYRLLSTRYNLYPNYSDNLVLKDTAAADLSNCGDLETAYLGEKKYPAMKVYYLKNDPCFRETYFYSLRNGVYAYDFVPIPSGGINFYVYDVEKKVKEDFPEFYRIMATLNFSIARSTVSGPTSKPGEVTNKPVKTVTRKPAGIRCPENIQHPHKSANKGNHRDEDCCPDPDEWPKAGCAYSAHDYSIMLKGPSHK